MRRQGKMSRKNFAEETAAGLTLNAAENQAKPKLLPIISPEDRAEQLLIEYQACPNPNMMLYFYEESPQAWLCPCGRRNKSDEAFCGHCGVARTWLIEHTSDTYLAERIAERKGAEAVSWRPLPGAGTADEHSAENENEGRPEAGVRKAVLADTRLAGYEGSVLRRFWLYMLRYGSPKRRLILLPIGLILLLAAAALLITLSS